VDDFKIDTLLESYC